MVKLMSIFLNWMNCNTHNCVVYFPSLHILLICYIILLDTKLLDILIKCTCRYIRLDIMHVMDNEL